ncbi:MAG: hypothetical protein KAS66_02330 [Candidatus Omnitrophica bacterium]|nr:hypothetical protein [Candidatus Omnitrophota bacterium]
MTDENIKNLRNLSKVCHRSGILPIFLGILVMFIGGIDFNAYVLAVGLLIFILGYSFVKIADKINKNIG